MPAEGEPLKTAKSAKSAEPVSAPKAPPTEAKLTEAKPAETKPVRVRFLRQVELIERVAAYDPTVDEGLLNRAYVYAMRMHGAQLRASGDPYFAHPIEVAGILTEYKLDAATIVTALLHDTIEDTPATHEEISGLFGEEIAQLVEGVTKLTRLELQSEYTKQSENLRKFILAISKDIRVLLIKLADRLHNMRTLHFVPEAKRERISRETLEVYAPLARSIGCNRFATELEDLAFSFINPGGYAAIQRHLEEMREDKGNVIRDISREVAGKLEKSGLFARVSGREKSPYSIWRKLERKSFSMAQLSDIYAFRVVVRDEDDCYRALGLIHRTWPVVQERFKDFISTPKSNNYQSLHTTVVGHKGTRVELQIRTEAMDRIAEEGLAAHWGYKNQTYGFDEEAATAISGRNPTDNLRNIISIVESGGDSDEWVEHAKMEMFVDQVFVFTPKGKLISLPRGAMPLDFAFAVHTEVGVTAVGCLINGENRPLRTILQNGDQVEILNGNETRVTSDWYSLATTGKAHAIIRRHLRQSQKEDFIKLGRRLMARAADQVDKDIEEISWRHALERFNLTSDDQLFELVGRDKIAPGKVIETVFPGLILPEGLAFETRSRITDGDGAQIFVRGTGLKETQKLVFSRCCFPVPGDRIVGYTDGNVVHVHSIECQELEALEEQKERWIDLQWTLDAEKSSIAVGRVRVVLANVPGVLGTACTLIGEAHGNIVNIQIRKGATDYLDVDFDIEVMDARHMATISAALRTCKEVESVERVRG